MKAKFQCTNADDMQFSLTVTMSLKRWKELKKQLSDRYPSWEFGSKITDMILQAEHTYWPERDQTTHGS